MSDEQSVDDEQCAALVAALEPSPVPWKGLWVCHKIGRRGIGIGATPAEAHEDYHQPHPKGERS